MVVFLLENYLNLLWNEMDFAYIKSTKYKY